MPFPEKRRPRYIMIVDDDRDTRELLQLSLESAGFQAVAVDHGSEALAALPHYRPCAIVLDLAMPVMDGPRFLDAMRHLADGHLAATPVIVLTGSDATRDHLLLHVDDLLRKPVPIEQLIASLQVYCDESGALATNQHHVRALRAAT